MTVKGRSVRTRAMTPREYARLMGIPEDYTLPDNQNAALHLSGDGVAVSVVAFLRTHLFEPVLDRSRALTATAE